MKHITKLICLLLVLSLMLAIPVSAMEIQPYASNYFMAHSCYLWEVSSTEFQVWFDVTAVRTMTSLGTDLIKVQRSTDKVNWEDVQTYTYDVYTNMVASNTGYHASYVTYSNRQPGYYYRAYVDLYAKDSRGTAWYSVYTSYI